MLKFPVVSKFSIDQMWNDIQINRIRSIDVGRDSFYRWSYYFIMKHVQSCRFDQDKESFEHFWQSIILVYSWMGRGILSDFSSAVERYKEVRLTIGEVQRTGHLDKNQLTSIVDVCNRSVVACSKYLHFLRPDKFAIWDSRVCASIFGRRVHHYQINNIDNLLGYFDWIRSLPASGSSLDEICTYLGIERSTGQLRAKEFVLFMSTAGAVVAD